MNSEANIKNKAEALKILIDYLEQREDLKGWIKKIPKLDKRKQIIYLGREITSVSLSSFQETQYYYLSVYSGPSLVGRIMFS